MVKRRGRSTRLFRCSVVVSARDHGRGRARQGVAYDAGDLADRRASLPARRPDAWIIDFTNPVGIVTRGLLDHGHRAVGLCNVAIGNQRTAASLLGVEPAQVLLDHVGLNHLTWTRRVLINGQDQLPELLATSADALAERSGLPAELLRRLGCGLPTISATSMNMITSSSSSERSHPGQRRLRRSSAGCWRCTPTRRLMRSRRCFGSVAVPTIPKLP